MPRPATGECSVLKGKEKEKEADHGITPYTVKKDVPYRLAEHILCLALEQKSTEHSSTHTSSDSASAAPAPSVAGSCVHRTGLELPEPPDPDSVVLADWVVVRAPEVVGAVVPAVVASVASTGLDAAEK